MTIARRRVPDIAKLQTFECAARHGSFTGAARELNLTQSAVSRQIKELEAQLAVPLFERVRQRVVLSGAGRRFLPEVRRLLRQTEESMLRVMSAPQGTAFSLAVLPTFGARWLVPRLPDFLGRNPDIWLNLASRSTPFDLAESSFDAAIHYGQPVWAGATCRYICREEIVPVAAPAFLARSGLSGMELLRAGPLLHIDTRPAAWNDWFALAGADDAPAHRGHRFDQFGMMIQAAVAGLGLALVPRYLIERELAEGSLQVVADQALRTENSYYLAIPVRELANPLVEQFYGWIVGQVSDRGSQPEGE
jgi:LysR family glycine cleavage system transcriptional activator